MVCQQTASLDFNLGSIMGFNEIKQGYLNITFTGGTPVGGIASEFHFNTPSHVLTSAPLVKLVLPTYFCIVLPMARVGSQARFRLTPASKNTIANMNLFVLRALVYFH